MITDDVAPLNTFETLVRLKGWERGNYISERRNSTWGDRVMGWHHLCIDAHCCATSVMIILNWYRYLSSISTISFYVNFHEPPYFYLILFLFQRVLLFSAYAITAMCQAGFDVIDVYPMTHSYPEGTLDNDIVHYPNKVFDAVVTLVENYKINNNQRIETDDHERKIRRCASWPKL